MSYDRYRVMDSKTPTARVKYTHYPKSGSPTSYTYGAATNAWSGSIKNSADVKNSHYAARVRRGEIVLNPCRFDTETRSSVNSSFTMGPHPEWGSESNSGDYAAFFEGNVPFPEIGDWTADLQTVQGIALVKAYSRVDPSIVLGGEILKDLDNSVGMLKRPFGESRDLLRRMEKFRLGRIGKTATSAIRAASSAWLEYRYGWRPIVLDSLAVMRASERIRRERLVRTLVARGSEKLTRIVEKDFSVSGGIPRLDSVSGKVRGSRKATVSAGVIYTVNQRTISQALQMVGGVRPSDITATLWEVIPYSFVVDWFANVGEWIQAISPNPYVEYKGNWVTSIEDYEKELYNVIGSCTIATNPVTTYNPSVGGSTRKWNHFTRYCNQPLPTTPVLRPTSVTKLQTVDGLALILGRIRGELKRFHH